MKVIPLEEALYSVKRYNKRKNYSQLIYEFDDDCLKEYNSAELYVERAVAYRENGYFIKALGDCGSAIAIDPTYAPAYYQKGLAYYQREDFEAAVEFFQGSFMPHMGNLRRPVKRVLAACRKVLSRPPKQTGVFCLYPAHSIYHLGEGGPFGGYGNKNCKILFSEDGTSALNNILRHAPKILIAHNHLSTHEEVEVLTRKVRELLPSCFIILTDRTDLLFESRNSTYTYDLVIDSWAASLIIDYFPFLDGITESHTLLKRMLGSAFYAWKLRNPDPIFNTPINPR